MAEADSHPYDSLTDKQHEAVQLVCDGYSSKEAAKLLDISHKSFDARVDAARRRLGAASRVELARIYAEHWGKTPREPFPIPPIGLTGAGPLDRSQGIDLRFGDAAPAFVEHAPWQEAILRQVPEFRSAEVGKGMRAVLMIGAALALAVVAMLVVGVANGLEELVLR